MNRKSLRRLALASLAALALGVGLSACGAANEQTPAGDTAAASSNRLSGTLNGAGSSAQEAAQGAWTSGFQTANPDVTVNYDPIGSGGGVEQFLAGGVQFAGSDAYLSDEQLTASKQVCHGQPALEVPDYISPIAVAYNLDGVDDLRLSAATLAAIMDGSITRWDDAAIKAENPGTSLPDQRVTPVHRSDDSGTTKNFTDYLHQATNGGWPEAAETWPVKSGEGAQGTSGVVAAIQAGAGTIGYADASQLGDLHAAKVKVGSEYVAASAESAAKVVDVSPGAKGRSGNDMAVDVARDTTASGAYPIVLVSYLIACPTYETQATASLVRGYLGYVVSSDGQKAAADAAGSAALSSALQSKAAGFIDQIEVKR